MLQPETVNLPEIYVKADTSNWEYHYEVFSRYFLGNNRAASGCQIRNPKTLVVYHDQLRNVFYAHAREAIQIENEYLGYQLTYEMKSFVYDVGQQTINYLGIPRFSKLSEDKKSDGIATGFVYILVLRAIFFAYFMLIPMAHLISGLKYFTESQTRDFCRKSSLLNRSMNTKRKYSAEIHP